MCIIVAKPMGVEMPEEETLERCFWKNPDGAGFMFADGKRVRIRKGFMKFDDFVDAINSELEGFDVTELGLVMHFRIATSGKVKPEICHPFPIESEPDRLRLTRLDSRFAVAHNGVISGRMTNDNWSDTMDFVKEVMAPLARMNPNFMHSSDALQLLGGACDSKLAIMDNSGEIATVGQFCEENGVLYSNTGYVNTVSYWSDYGSLWDRSSYFEYYPEPKGFRAWEDMDELIAELPYEACANCPVNEECALNFPECGNEKTAAASAEYFNELEKAEVRAWVE